MVASLGVDGMSSDEEVVTAGMKEFRIIRKPWRNAAITPWLRDLDVLDHRDRGGVGQGREPHARIPHSNGASVSNRPAVKQLPRNAYDDDWWNSQSGTRRRELEVDTGANAYVFRHSDSVQRYVISPSSRTHLLTEHDRAIQEWLTREQPSLTPSTVPSGSGSSHSS